jgi:protein-disulfide isomerase
VLALRQVAGGDDVRPELRPPAYVLHPCAEPGCRTLALAARCEAHAGKEDRERLAAMHDATLRAAHAEELWIDALRDALEAEQAAGVRRAE